MKEFNIINSPSEETLEMYAAKFKALSDKKRLHILNLLCQHGTTCVCDLAEIVGMPQSKLSYHLKILLDAELITKETRGTWGYYTLNESEIRNLLSNELCCVFVPNGNCC